MDKLKDFMKDRPHDKNKNVQDAVIEYIEHLEKASVERYHEITRKRGA